MYPEIRLFGRTIGTYGLCSFFGFALSVFVGWILAKRWKNTIDDVLLLALPIAAGLFLGGHLLAPGKAGRRGLGLRPEIILRPVVILRRVVVLLLPRLG